MTAVLSALILDLDGVVADTEPVSLSAIAATYAAGGVTLDERELRDLVGIEFNRLERVLRARHSVHADEAWLRTEYDRRYMARLQKGLDPSPGLIALLDALRLVRVPVGVASSSPLHQVELVLQATGVRSKIDVVAAGSEVERTKPAPDVYTLALSRLGVQPARAVAVEDSTPGIAAARAAGLVCAALRTSSTGQHDLRGAAIVVSSLEDLSLDRLNTLVDRERRRVPECPTQQT